MNKISLKANGKVNLGLDVTGRRDDGYHLVRMIMQTVDVSDDVTVSCRSAGNDPEVTLFCDNPRIPSDRRNLAFKAAELVMHRYDIKACIHIDIRKNIPMEAGMAGGSADAAAVIRGLNTLFDLGMDMREMDETALMLGADVPFCLRQGTYLAEGIGEKLTRLEDLMHCFMVIIKPGISVSTPWAYKALDKLIDDPDTEVVHPDIDKMVKAVSAHDIICLSDSMGNILEEPVIREYEEIGRIKQVLKENGALAALMSGSGSAVFGIFADSGSADRAFSLFQGEDYGKFKVEF